jgi:hypothetical protein
MSVVFPDVLWAGHESNVTSGPIVQFRTARTNMLMVPETRELCQMVPQSATLNRPMPSDCSECRRLWQQYQDATFNHIELDNKRRLAVLRRDLKVIAILTPQVEQALAERRTLQQTLRRHEARHGTAAADAATSGS